MSTERLKLVEMVGICGAGKSSLRRALHAKDSRFVFLPPPNKFFYIPFFFRSLLFWFVLYICKYRGTRWFTGQEIRTMAYLESWLPYLMKNADQKGLIVVLDPGSVYWLSELHEFGPEITHSAEFKKWWDGMFERWTLALDALIWLDAPDQLLYERVIKRAEFHEVQTQTQEEAVDSFVKLRRWYSKIIQMMTSQREIKVFAYRTDQVSTEQMTDELLSQLTM